MGPKKHPQQTDLDQARDEASRHGLSVCACGKTMSLRSTRCKRCTCRAAQARYQRTEKGKATKARYRKTPLCRAAKERYLSTPRAQQVAAALNARRVYIGQQYHGRAQTVEQASAIQQHVKERIREFKLKQAGA